MRAEGLKMTESGRNMFLMKCQLLIVLTT